MRFPTTWLGTWKPQRISQRLMLAVGIPLALTVFGGLAVLTALRCAVQAQLEMERSDRVIETASGLLRQVAAADAATRSYARSGDDSLLAAYDEAQQAWRIAIQVLHGALGRDSGQVERLQRIDQLFQRWRHETTEPMIARSRAGSPPAVALPEPPTQPGAGARSPTDAGREVIDALRALDYELMSRQRADLETSLQSLSARRRSALIAAAAILAVALATGLLLLLGLARRLLIPIHSIARAADALERGAVAERAKVYSEDELGRLARSFNRMAARLDVRERQAARLHELSQLLQTATDAGEAIAIFERLTPVLVPGGSGALYLISPSRDDLELRSRFGRAEHDLETQTAPCDCWALRQGHSYLVPDVDRKLVCEHLGGRHGLRDPYACLPLVTQGDTLGLLHVSFAAEALLESPLEQRVDELEAIATSLGLALANLALRERLKAQSVRDPLTGLYNRRFLEESLSREIERCRRRAQPLTLVMADLDHFKQLNDTWGHEAGDLAIQRFAEAARRHFRSEDILCRYGGEEFCFVLPECSLEDARIRAEALLEAQRKAIVRFGRDAVGPVTTSLGLAAFPGPATDAVSLLRLADAALYRAKLGGRDRLIVHDGTVAA